MTATRIPIGTSAKIESLLMDGAERRRLMDLGFCPGVEIKRVLDAPFGGTPAFLVRGTVIALRDDQSDLIEVTPCKN